jgi:predicted ArsR family transcriptional regulator
MDTLVLLYILNLRSDPFDSESGVGRNELAGYLGCSYNTVKKHLAIAVDSGLIKQKRVYTKKGHNYTYKYRVTSAGQELLEKSGRGYELYAAWRDKRTLDEIRKIKGAFQASLAKTKKQAGAEKAGQKTLWDM